MKENQKMKLVYKYENNCDKQLKEGMIVEGTIKSIQQYGAFIEIENGTVGLLHIQDISVARIKPPAERITFSYKELLGTWQENANLFNEGDIVVGIARETEKNHNGIFVELKPNLVGLAEYKPDIVYGENVIVNIKKIIPEKKKIKLMII